ncbi:MAG: hypothetical protein WC175_01875 [Candidatus Dojkabacteria bacterium]|jgi:hypothetical protein
MHKNEFPNQTSLIIEGPNLVGKSFITDQLKAHGAIVYKGLSSYPPEITTRYGLEKIFKADMYICDFLRQSGLSITFERSPLSGIIYNKLPKQCFDDFLKLLPNPVLYILTAPEYFLRERYEENLDHMEERDLSFQDLVAINLKYQAIATKWNFPCKVVLAEIAGPDDSNAVIEDILSRLIAAQYEEEE